MNADTRLRVTTDDELVAHFEGVMIGVTDPFIGGYSVPGWKCKHCGWIVGSIGYPPSHQCPDDGGKQQTASPQSESETR